MKNPNSIGIAVTPNSVSVKKITGAAPRDSNAVMVKWNEVTIAKSLL
jgi:hypothetical protein